MKIFSLAKLTRKISLRKLYFANKYKFLHKATLNATLFINRHKKSLSISATGFDLYGSPGRARTADLVINSHPLYQLSYRGRIFISINGAPGEIRTPDRSVRSRVLYPAELRAPYLSEYYALLKGFCQT